MTVSELQRSSGLRTRSADRFAGRRKSAQTGNDVISNYVHEVESMSVLTRQKEEALAILASRGVKSAKQRLIEANLRLVVNMVREYKVDRQVFMDLIEEGNIGLLLAVDKFDPQKKLRFSIYVRCWIRHMIAHAIASYSRTIHLPLQVVRQIGLCKRASSNLLQSLQHEPNLSEVANLTNNSISTLSRLMTLNKVPISLDSTVSGGNGLYTVQDYIAEDSKRGPEQNAYLNEVMKLIGESLQGLTQEQREVVCCRFGLQASRLSQDETQSIEQIAMCLRMSPSRAQRVLDQALFELQKIFARQGHHWADVLMN